MFLLIYNDGCLSLLNLLNFNLNIRLFRKLKFLLFNQLLLSDFSFFLTLFLFLLHVLLPFRSMRFPNNPKYLIWVIRSNRRFSIFAFQFEFNELGFLFSLIVSIFFLVLITGLMIYFVIKYNRKIDVFHGVNCKRFKNRENKSAIAFFFLLLL